MKNIFYKFFNSKKGLELLLSTILGLILAAGAIVFLLVIGSRFFGIFIGSQEYDATINNFNEITLQINNIIESDGSKDEIETPYYIHKSFNLVGFGLSSERVLTTCGNKEIKKPGICTSKACLCLYKDIDEEPFRCVPYSDQVNFAASDSGDDSFFGYVVPGTQLENLVLMGDNCPNIIPKKGWKIQTLKITYEGNNVIFEKITENT